MPSSKFLIKKMLSNIDFSNAKVIVEYGPGNGIITKHILNKMNNDAILICFEINKEFVKCLQLIDDKRLVVTQKSAENIAEILQNLKIDQVDCFISSLPLSILPYKMAKNILINSKQVLKNKGLFIQYQYSFNFLKTFQAIFNKKNVFLTFEILNLPPAFIYKCIHIN